MIYGEVFHGDGEGQGTGYPTANLSYEIFAGHNDGIYAVWAQTAGVKKPGVLILGVPGGNQQKKAEVFIMDFQGDLYGEVIGIEIVKRIRELFVFHDRTELLRAIENDIQQARRMLYEGH